MRAWYIEEGHTIASGDWSGWWVVSVTPSRVGAVMLLTVERDGERRRTWFETCEFVHVEGVG